MTETRRDAVDEILRQWKTARPQVDVWPIAIIGRISRLGKMIDERMRIVCSNAGLERWSFDLLAALRRSGPTFALTPTQLCKSLLLTSGAMTHRIDRLEAAGFVKRTADPEDRRGLRVVLTSQGRKLIDRALIVHMEVEAQLIAGLSFEHQHQLAGLLRLLSSSIASVGPINRVRRR